MCSPPATSFYWTYHCLLKLTPCPCFQKQGSWLTYTIPYFSLHLHAYISTCLSSLTDLLTPKLYLHLYLFHLSFPSFPCAYPLAQFSSSCSYTTYHVLFIVFYSQQHLLCHLSIKALLFILVLSNMYLTYPAAMSTANSLKTNKCNHFTFPASPCIFYHLQSVTHLNLKEWLTGQDFSFSNGKNRIKVISAQETFKGN